MTTDADGHPLAEVRGVRFGDVAAVAADERDRRGRSPARSSQPLSPSTAASGVLLRARRGGELGRSRRHRGGEVGEVVLPLDAAVGADPRVEVHAALGRPAGPAESERRARGRRARRATPSRSGRRRSRGSASGPALGSMPGVMSMTTSSRTRSGRDAATAAAVRPPSDWPTSSCGPSVHAPMPGDDVGREDARDVGERPPATTSRRDRGGRWRAPGGRARGSWCPTCGRSAPRRAGR